MYSVRVCIAVYIATSLKDNYRKNVVLRLYEIVGYFPTARTKKGGKRKQPCMVWSAFEVVMSLMPGCHQKRGNINPAHEA